MRVDAARESRITHTIKAVAAALAGSESLTIGRRLELVSLLSAALGREIDLVDLRGAHGLLLTQILTTGRTVRNEAPAFVAEKALEMYDCQTFLEPAVRAARHARIAALNGAIDAPARRRETSAPDHDG